MKRLTGVTVLLAGIGALGGIFGMSQATPALAGQEGFGFWLVTVASVVAGRRRRHHPPPDRLDLMATRLRRAVVAAAAAVIVVVLGSCGVAPAPTGSPGQSSAPSTPPAPEPSDASGQPVVLEGRDAGFALSLRIGSDAVDAGAPLDVGATLTWEGAEPQASIWASGSGPVSFGIKQVDGDIALDAVQTADCAQHDFTRGVAGPGAVSQVRRLLGRRSERGLLPRLLRRPGAPTTAGRWRIAAGAGGFLVPCEMDAPMVEIRLEAEVVVR